MSSTLSTTVASPSTSNPIHVAAFNHLEMAPAAELLRACLDVPRWWTTLLMGRPYRDYESLLEAARDAAYPFTAAELEAAVDHHLRHRRPADTRALHDGRADLPTTGNGGIGDGIGDPWAELAAAYARRFGRPFIVRAAGRSTAEIGGLLTARLGNDIDTEDRVVATQLRQIALLALTRRVAE